MRYTLLAQQMKKVMAAKKILSAGGGKYIFYPNIPIITWRAVPIRLFIRSPPTQRIH